MRVSFFLLIFLVIVISYFLIDFFTHLPESSEFVPNEDSPPLFLGLVAGTGGFSDKSYNDSLYSGLIQAMIEFGIDFIERSPMKMNESHDLLKEIIDEGVQVVFAGGGFYMREPVDSLARAHPDIKFVLFDDFAIEYLPNVASVTFRQNEAAFMVGALAAIQSKTNTLCVISAMYTDVLNDSVEGFEAGARYIKPQIKVIKEYIDRYDFDTDPFSNPKVAYELATDMYENKNVDIIFQVCRGSGFGVINASIEQNKFTIGSGFDQDHLAQGNILASMEKKIDLGMIKMIQIILNDEFENKSYSFGLDSGLVSMSNLTFTRDLIGDTNILRLNYIESKILNKDLVVPSRQVAN